MVLNLFKYKDNFISPREKRPGREAHYSTPFTDEVQNS
jgi:hypothetical protein